MTSILQDTIHTVVQDRNVINGVSSVALTSVVDFYENLMPYLMLAVVLVLVDTRFGVEAAVKRGEKIRPSRMWRRAVNKLVDYICWVTLAGFIGKAFGQVLGMPILSAIMLLVVYGIEISSCYNNYFEARGVKKKLNIWKIFGRSDIGDAIEDIKEEREDEK